MKKLTREQVEQIQKSAVAKGESANLQRTNLQGLDLSELNLTGAMSCDPYYGWSDHGANLRGANLAEVNLNGAKLGLAFLRGAYIVKASLIGADFTGADFTGANFYGANLCGANLESANLRGADLEGADLDGANLCDANLYGANLKSANLRGANLLLANLTKANIEEAVIRGADLRGADLTEADLTGADLSGADLSRTYCSDANFESEHVIEVKLIRANLTGANLAGANLTRANLTGADLTCANLTKANLTRANLTRANLREADFEGANLSGAIYYEADLRVEPLKPHAEPQPKFESPISEIVPSSVKSKPSELQENLFTEYSKPPQFEQEIPWKYPIAITPAKGCIVRSHREGATKRRGRKDESFENSIRSYFGKQLSVSGTVRLVTGEDTRAYEPDIAIIDESSGLNIRIDIEIDEPYAGITRQATHCIGEDDLRDIYFIQRGWAVIRFSEYQVHQQENECLAFIAKYLKAINPNFHIPSDLQDVGNPITEKQWDLVQAQKWEQEKWREEYLQHTFGSVPDVPEPKDTGLNEQEKEEETNVKSRSFGKHEAAEKIGFNERNEHARDKRIRFYPEPHIYEIDGVTAQSVSTIVSRFFPEFDVFHWSRVKAIERIQQEGGELTEENIQKVATEIAQEWKNRADAASRAGTFLHEQIEKFYLQRPYEQPEEFPLFQQFVEAHGNLEPFRTEWRVFDERKSIAGTIDLIVKNGDGFDLYDWKRSKKIINPINGATITRNDYQRGIGELKHLDDTSFNRYSIQQNIYRTILETRYGLTVNQMYLVVIHPNYDKFYKIPVDRLDEEVKFIYSSL